jgi:hypothetical protein
MEDKIKISLIGLFVLLTIASFGQVDSTNRKAVKLTNKNLTFFWVCHACPTFIDTKYKYGFTIKRSGDIMTPFIKRNNRKVVRQINKIYGKNWFEENKSHFF